MRAMATLDASGPSIADADPPRARLAAFRHLSDRLETIAEAEREQLPLWLPVGLMLGIGAWFYLPCGEEWAAFLFAAAAASLCRFLKSRI